MKKQLLLSLIGVFFINHTYAEESQNYAVVDRLTESNFIKDSHIQLSLRNYGKYLNDDEMGGKKMVHTAWGQAFAIGYTSGYLGDFIGVDASFVSVAKLGASTYFSSRSLLWNDGAGFNKHNARSFNKFDQRYVKIKLGSDDSLNYKAKLGWQVINKYGVLKASNQLSKNSYLGYTGTFKYDNFSLDTLYVTSSMNRDSPQKTHFLSADKRHINSIVSVGVNYKNDNLSVSYAVGDADDYMQRHLLDITYTPYNKLILGSQIYVNRPLSGYSNMKPSQRAADGNARYYAVDAKWIQDKTSIKFGIAYTHADKKNGELGYFRRHITGNARWRFETMTEAAYHYQRNGELALTLLADYKYHPDFYSAIQLNYGQFNYKNNTFKVGEINWINQWTPSDSRLKNFTIFSKVGAGLTYQNVKNKQPIFDNNGHYKKANSISGEIIIDYKFNLL